MGYKNLIIKIQKLQANYNREMEEIKDDKSLIVPYITKDTKLNLYEKFSDDLDNLLKSEEYGMKKHFKY